MHDRVDTTFLPHKQQVPRFRGSARSRIVLSQNLDLLCVIYPPFFYIYYLSYEIIICFPPLCANEISNGNKGSTLGVTQTLSACFVDLLKIH